MKKMKESYKGIALGLFELVVGILLLVNPLGFTSGIIMTVGAALILTGLVSTIKYFKANAAEAAKGQLLFKGLLALMIGVFCVLRDDWFVTIFPAITILYGLGTLVCGVAKVQFAVDHLRMKDKQWYWMGISALTSIVCACIILASPFATTAVLWTFTGVSLIAEAVLDVLAMIMERRSAQKAFEIR